MLIQSDNSYKSIGPIQPPVEMPDLVILSGINGSGKSQLLVALSQGVVKIYEKGEPVQSVRLVDHNTLVPNDSETVIYQHLRSTILSFIEMYHNYKAAKNSDANADIRNFFSNNDRLILIVKRIAEKAGKPVDMLSDDDFFNDYPLEDSFGNLDMFQQNFSALFKRYAIRRYENDLNQFRNQKYGNIGFLSDEEFLEKYGEPPWVLVNKIIEEAKLDYQITSPEADHHEAPFQVKLLNKLNGAEINFNELSSGEKVIMSLALSLYNSRLDMVFPKVLLMDEPDAHLHPSMTKDFLEVIQNIFINGKGMKVIITTHSPSTVALAPEESLFIMNKVEPRIIKATKDTALQIITSGVPTLSINYENRRQVFVESKYDVVFYDKVYEKLRGKLVPQISINFISSGVGGKGSCDQVKEVVNKLTGYGTRSIYGIVDWDLKNNGNEFVKVLGKDKRYSVENYIFDPIFLAAFLLRERYVDRALIGLSEGDRYTDFSNFSNTKLQAIADFIVNQVRTKVGNSTDVNPQEVEYVGGNKINLPSWFLTIKGHDLEAMLKELFPQLNRYTREGELKGDIINKVIDDIPEFIPKEVLTLLGEIQNYKVEST